MFDLIQNTLSNSVMKLFSLKKQNCTNLKIFKKQIQNDIFLRYYDFIEKNKDKLFIIDKTEML